jgi:hypothetical protein
MTRRNPNWVCTACGMASTRNWNVKRHVMNVHDGECEIITYMEYRTGVRSGAYAGPVYPNSLGRSSSFLSEKDRLRKLQERGIIVNFSLLKNDSWKNKAMAMVNQVISSYPEGMIKVYGSDYAENRHGSRYDNYPEGSNNRKIVGYCGWVCDNCLAICALEIYQDKGNHKVYCRRHDCQLGQLVELPYMQDGNNSKPKLISRLDYQELPWLMIYVIKAPEKKLGTKCHLFAERMKYAVLDENYISVNINGVAEKDHWLLDLLMYGKIEEPEIQVLWDFLGISQMRTYSAFRVYGAISYPYYYCMGIGFD